MAIRKLVRVFFADLVTLVVALSSAAVSKSFLESQPHKNHAITLAFIPNENTDTIRFYKSRFFIIPGILENRHY